MRIFFLKHTRPLPSIIPQSLQNKKRPCCQVRGNIWIKIIFQIWKHFCFRRSRFSAFISTSLPTQTMFVNIPSLSTNDGRCALDSLLDRLPFKMGTTCQILTDPWLENCKRRRVSIEADTAISHSAITHLTQGHLEEVEWLANEK